MRPLKLTEQAIFVSAKRDRQGVRQIPTASPSMARGVRADFEPRLFQRPQVLPSSPRITGAGLPPP